MNVTLSLTILTIVLSITILSVSIAIAVAFYRARQKRARITNTPPMVKTMSPIPMLRSLHQLKQNDYYDARVYSDSEDSGAVLNAWNGYLSNNEQKYHSADDLSDFEYTEQPSNSSASSSSGDGGLFNSREPETDTNELFNTPSSSTSNSPVMTASRLQCTLNLSLKYDFHQESLTVEVINASNPPKQYNLSKRLLVVVQLFKMRQNGEYEDVDPMYKTNIKPYSTNVLFNEEFKYEGIQHNELNAISTKFSLCSHDRFSRVQTIGDFIIELNYVTFDPVKAIMLQRQIQKEIPSVAIVEKDKGELLLSLRYQSGSGRINVIVLKALNLKKPKIFMSNDPYITIKLLYKGDVISKKKTTVKKGTFPIWNEPFAFDLVETDVDNYHFVFAVKSRDLFSSRTKLGTVCVGPQASFTGKDHWKASVRSKNNAMRQVTMGHKLL